MPIYSQWPWEQVTQKIVHHVRPSALTAVRSMGNFDFTVRTPVLTSCLRRLYYVGINPAHKDSYQASKTAPATGNDRCNVSAFAKMAQYNLLCEIIVHIWRHGVYAKMNSVSGEILALQLIAVTEYQRCKEQGKVDCNVQYKFEKFLEVFKKFWYVWARLLFIVLAELASLSCVNWGVPLSSNKGPMPDVLDPLIKYSRVFDSNFWRVFHQVV